MGARGFQPDENVSPMGGLSMANKKWRHKRGVSSYKDWLFYESILQSLQTIKIQHLGKGLMASSPPPYNNTNMNSICISIY